MRNNISLTLEPLLVSTNIFGSGFRNFVPSFLEVLQDFNLHY
jgi:hypothetical protein